MIMETTLESTEQMEEMIAKGMDEGTRLTMGQIDAILAKRKSSRNRNVR